MAASEDMIGWDRTEMGEAFHGSEYNLVNTEILIRLMQLKASARIFKEVIAVGPGSLLWKEH